MENFGRSNRQSSIDSMAERPKTQAGEVPDSAKAGPSGFSKLLNSRRRRKMKTNQRHEEEPPVPGVVTEQDLLESRSNESRDGDSIVPSSTNSLIPPESEVITLLTDDSEPEKYATLCTGVMA